MSDALAGPAKEAEESARGRLTPRGVLFALLPLFALPALALLRSLNAETPRLPLLPSPFDSLLLVALVLLLAAHLVDRRRGGDLLDPRRPGEPLRLAEVVPLLALLVGEKWVSVAVLAGAYDWIDERLTDPRVADALYRLWSGLALLALSLAALWLMRQVRPRLARTLGPRRFTSALILVLAAGGLTGLLVAGLPALLGAPVAPRPGGIGLLAAISGAQLVRGVAEELFFRGLVQLALLRILVRAGWPYGRAVRLFAIAAVSLAFTLEHIDPTAGLGASLRALVFVFALSSVFGVLYEASRNLPLTMAAHVLVNLAVAGVLPVPVDEAGRALLPPMVPASLALAAIFFGVVIAHRRQGHA